MEPLLWEFEYLRLTEVKVTNFYKLGNITLCKLILVLKFSKDKKHQNNALAVKINSTN